VQRWLKVSSCTAINYCCYFTYATTYNGATITSQTTCLQYTAASQNVINTFALAASTNAQNTFTSSVNCGSNQMINTTTGVTSNTQLTNGGNVNSNSAAAQIASLGVLFASAATGNCYANSNTPYSTSYCNNNSTSTSQCCYFTLTNNNATSSNIYTCLPQAIAVNASSIIQNLLSSNASASSQISYGNQCTSSILSVVLKYLAILIIVALF